MKRFNLHLGDSGSLIILACLGIIMVLEVLAASEFAPVLYGQVSSQAVNLKNLSTEVKDLEKAQAVLASQDEAGISGNLTKARAALPEEKKISGLVTGLASLATASGMALISLDFSPGLISTKSADPLTIAAKNDQPVIGKVRAVPATLAIKGNLSSLTTFLQKLRVTSQLIGVTNISYGSIRAQSEATLSILIYYLPREAKETDWANVQALTNEEMDSLKSLDSKDIFTLTSPM